MQIFLSRAVTAIVLVVVVAGLTACQSFRSAPPAQATPPARAEQRVPPTATASAPPLALPPSAQPVPPTERLRSDTPSLRPFLTRPARPLGDDPGMPPPAPPLEPEVTRIGVLLPLSGPDAELGKGLLNAAQLAMFDFADDRFEMVVHDTGGTPDGAARAAALAIGDGAALIVGPLLAGSVRAVAPAARAAGVKVIALSSDRSVAGDDIFTMGFLPSTEVRRVVAHAYGEGATRFAAFVPSNAYGRAVVQAMRDAAQAVGAQISRVAYYDPQADDFTNAVRGLADYDSRRAALVAQRQQLAGRGGELSRRALKRLENLQTIGELPFDALLLPEGGKRLQAIAALLPYYDIDPAKVRMLGTGKWDFSGMGAEPALVGGWFAAPPPTARAEFEKDFSDVYGKPPPRLATLAYDAVALAAVLAQSAGGPEFPTATLTDPSGFAGRDGIFRFMPDGVTERGLAVLQVESRGVSLAAPAPVGFTAPAY